MSGRASGDDRRSRRRESRSRSRERHHGRRGRSPSPAWDDRYRPRSRTRSRSRSRSRSRHRSRRDRSRSRGRGGSRSRSRGRSRSRDRHDVHSRYRSTFTSGGRVYEDNGGLPALEGHHNADHPSGRLRQYADALSAGLDAALDTQPYGDGGSASRRPPPSNVLCIRGLPEDAEEADLYKLFEPVPGVVAVRVVRERHTQKCRGFAYLELSTPEAAAALMDSDWRDQTYFGEHRLRFSFDAMGRPAGGSGASGAGAMGPGGVPSDWLCEFCKALNFGRRFECYQCSSARTPNAQRVSIEPDAPSYILRAAGLEPQTSEEALYYLFAPVAPVKEIRLVRDKYTGSPRGFAFVHFYTVADAAKALNALQNSQVAGQESLLKLSFARDRFGQLPAAPEAAQGALQTAGSDPMLGAGEVYSGWEPQSFQEGEGQEQGGAGGVDYAAWEPKAFEEDGEAAGAEQAEQQEQQGGGTAVEAPAAAWPAEQQHQHGQQQPQQPQQQGYGGVGDPAAGPAAGAAQDGAGQASWAGDLGAAGMPAGAVGQAGNTEWVAAYTGEHPTEAAGAAAAAGGAVHDPPPPQQQPQFSAACYAPDPPGYDPFTGGMEAAAGAGAEAQYAEQAQQAQQAGFEYDPETGYMKDPVSGYLYDANTGMYFHPQLRQWGSYDHATQQFVPYEDPALAAAGSHAMHAAAAPGVSTAADSALGAANAALYMSKVAGPAAAAQQQQHFRHQAAVSAQKGQQRLGAAVAAAPQKRKGAVIGAAPKLDPQGLLEAAKAAEEKAQLLQKLKEQQEHRAAVAAAKQRAQQATAAQQPQQQQQQPQQQQQGQQAAGGAGVQGVIHRGKWARKG